MLNWVDCTSRFVINALTIHNCLNVEMLVLSLIGNEEINNIKQIIGFKIKIIKIIKSRWQKYDFNRRGRRWFAY
jgi:hypothetical protein